MGWRWVGDGGGVGRGLHLRTTGLSSSAPRSTFRDSVITKTWHSVAAAFEEPKFTRLIIFYCPSRSYKRNTNVLNYRLYSSISCTFQ